MFERVSRSWGLVKASASVLTQDKELLLFPIVSLGAMLVVLACFALPMFGLGVLNGGLHGSSRTVSAGLYLVGFLFYFAHYFVIFFFNAALVGAAMMRLEGKDTSFSDGLRIASSKVGVIAGYALIAATVGVVLRLIQERVGFIGKIIVGLLGVSWTLATYLVVPVLVSKDVGPIDAVKESALLLKKTWGENLIGNLGIGAGFAFIYLGVIACAVALVGLAVMSHSTALIVSMVLVCLVAIAITVLVQAALSGIYEAALYRYATEGEGSSGFDSSALKLAFSPK